MKSRWEDDDSDDEPAHIPVKKVKTSSPPREHREESTEVPIKKPSVEISTVDNQEEEQKQEILEIKPVNPISDQQRTNALLGPHIQSCRSVDNFENLNRIDEGAYGIVYRARNRDTDEIVALKKLKLENEKNGFPVTSLREIYTLLLAKHENIVDVKEIVVKPDFRG